MLFARELENFLAKTSTAAVLEISARLILCGPLIRGGGGCGTRLRLLEIPGRADDPPTAELVGLDEISISDVEKRLIAAAVLDKQPRLLANVLDRLVLVAAAAERRGQTPHVIVLHGVYRLEHESQPFVLVLGLLFEIVCARLQA